MKTRLDLAFAIVSLIGALIGAVPQARAASPHASLDGPEITKLSWSSRALRAGDLDDDGRTDLAVLDNEAARILLLYQMTDPADGQRVRGEDAEGQPEDGRFRVERLLTGSRMYDLAIGDLDGDGHNDLISTGTPEGLVIRRLGPKGYEIAQRFPSVEPVTWSDSLLVEDLDGDGDRDLVVLDEVAALVYLQRDGRLEGPERLPLGVSRAFALRLDDLDGDGIRDLRYQTPRSNWQLRYRLGRGDGTFGPEQAFNLAPLRSAAVASSSSPFRLAVIDDATGVVSINDVTRLTKTKRNNEVGRKLDARVIATGRSGARSLWARGDLDGDGRLDLATTSNERSEVLWIAQPSPGRLANPVAFPALDDPIALIAADTNGDGVDELVIASAKDRQVAIMSMNDAGRLSFPKPIELTGRPLALTVADLDDDGKDELIIATEDDEASIDLFSRQGDTWQRSNLHEGLEVNSIRAVDLDQDGRLDLALSQRSKPLRVSLQDENGRFSLQDAAGASVRVPAAKTSTGDVDGDGIDELLIASEGHARALRWGSGGFEVVDQLNARSVGSELAAATVIDLDGDGRLEALLIPEGGGSIELLRRDRLGVWRFEAAIESGALDLVGIDRCDLDGDGSLDLLLYGDGRTLWIPVGSSELRLERLASWDSNDLDDRTMAARLLGSGDLDGDGTAELIAVDNDSSRLLHLLEIDGDQIKSTLAFPVFEADPHYRGPTGAANEPRELLVEDLTGDGKADVALLVHDRLLVYPSH